MSFYWQCFIVVSKVSKLNFVCPVVSKSFFQKLDDGWVVPVPVAFNVDVASLQLAEFVLGEVRLKMIKLMSAFQMQVGNGQ